MWCDFLQDLMKDWINMAVFIVKKIFIKIELSIYFEYRQKLNESIRLLAESMRNIDHSSSQA